ncbi:MAG: ABC transporter ATP-binding protein [Fimbriimonas sp.]|nr:ABC transporter ATP-binding protein [Fimbriimonas sp.]
MPDVLLECRQLSCGYGKRSVLSGIDLRIGRGETVVLLGPNGSGKSTLLKSISRSGPITGGDILLSGRPLASFSHREVARQVAFVPQEESFKFDFLVRDVVTMGRLPLSNSLWDTPEDVEAATEAMTQADCLFLQDRSVMALSGGEKQRVLIARALAQGAPLVLFDEPTSHLDVEHQLVVQKVVRHLASTGRSTITAIHDLNLAPLVGDRAILIHDGRVGMDASIQEVLESRLLDEIYKVEFVRTKLDSGRLAVFPK